MYITVPSNPIIKTIKSYAILLKDTAVAWSERDPFRNSTVIAYYTIFSLPGLLVIVINITGYVFGRDAVVQRILVEISTLAGKGTAEGIATIIKHAETEGDLTLSSIFGVATLLFGASGVFYQLQQTLNHIWNVQPQSVPAKSKMIKLIKDRIFSFGLVLAVGFLLLVSLTLSTILSTLSEWVAQRFSASLNVVFNMVDIAVSLAMITFLFASIFKLLPDAEIKWKDVWVGALVTALLFVLAKFAISFYIGHSNPGSAYEAAGSLVLIMLWVTYSGLILFFGAEFTLVFTKFHGDTINPSDFAERVDETVPNTGNASINSGK